MSQLLVRLQQELLTATEPNQRAELLARIAGNLARMKRFPEARQVIEDLRRTYNDGRSGRVTVWIMLAEGLTQLYENLNPEASDRINRALALGVAMKYSTMIALAAAWKSHIEFEWGRYEEMANSLRLAQDHCDAENLDAGTRIAMVLCNAFTICGDRPNSQYWFLRAKDLASKNGDQPSTMALIYNRAAFLTTRARAENCIQNVPSESLRPIRMEFESARNFQGLTRLVAYPSHLLLWDARLQILEGRYVSAIQVLKQVRTQSPFADHNFSQSFIDLEVCFCHMKSDHLEDALRGLERVATVELDEMDVDEQMVGTWMLWNIATMDSRFGVASDLQVTLEARTDIYARTMGSVAAALTAFALAK
jgi:hypothetical protein